MMSLFPLWESPTARPPSHAKPGPGHQGSGTGAAERKPPREGADRVGRARYPASLAESPFLAPCKARVAATLLLTVWNKPHSTEYGAKDRLRDTPGPDDSSAVTPWWAWPHHTCHFCLWERQAGNPTPPSPPPPRASP